MAEAVGFGVTFALAWVGGFYILGPVSDAVGARWKRAHLPAFAIMILLIAGAAATAGAIVCAVLS